MAKEKTKERKKRSKRKERKVKRKQDGGLFINSHSNTARVREGAHARKRHLPCTCSYAEAGEASAEIVCNCFPHCAKDFALWAWYCRHFNRRLIIDKAYYYVSCHRQGEVRDGVSAFQAWLRKEYGAKPEAGSCMTSQGFSEFINSGSAADAKGLYAVVGEAVKAGGAA